MRTDRLLILIAIFAFSAGQFLFAADDTTAGRKELERIKREMREKKKEIKRVDKRERSILTEFDRIDRQVLMGKAELAEQEKRLHDALTSLKDVEKNNAEIGYKLTLLKRVYGERLRALYKMSRNGYGAALLASPHQVDMLKKIKYLGMIARRDRMLIRDYGNVLASLSLKRTEIAEKKEEIVERKREIEIKKADLEARKKKKALLLASVREEKGLYEQSLQELEESSASLWAMVRQAEQERKRAKAERPSLEKQSRSDRAGKRLQWPLQGEILTRFGMQQHPQFKTMVFRRGIEIAAREGEPVHAVRDGVVKFSDWYKGYGNLMILEHEAGFYTLYGNLSRLDLNKDARVLQGQVIGLAGDTGSVKGPKLYFEIRRNGEAQDPLLWLSKR